MKKLKKFFYAFIALSIFGLVSCRNTNDPDPEPVPIPPEPVIVRELVGIEVQKVGLDKFLTTDDVFDFVYIKVILKYDDGTTSEVLLDDINDLPTDWEIDYAAFTENLKKDEAERVTPEGEGLEIDVFYQKDINTRLKATYKISVIAPPDPASAKRIEVYAPPAKLEYKHLVEEDKVLNTQGLIMKVIYEEADPNAEPPVEEDFLLRYPYIDTDPWKFVGFSNNDPQNDDKLQSIAVRYALDPTTYNETDDTTYIELPDAFKVDVVTQVLGFDVASDSAHKKDYLVGDVHDKSGLKLAFMYSNPNKNANYEDFTETDTQKFEFTFDNAHAAWQTPVTVRRFEKNEAGEWVLKNECKYKVDVYAGSEILIPATLTANGKNVFFEGEPEDFFTEEFIDGNSIEIKATVRKGDDQSDTSLELAEKTWVVPFSDPRVSTVLEGDGFDSTNRVFVVPTGALASSATLQVGYQEPGQTKMGKGVGLSVLPVFKFTDDVTVATKEYVITRVGTDKLLDITEKLDGTNAASQLYSASDGLDEYKKLFVTYGYYPQSILKYDDDLKAVPTVFNQARRTIYRGGFKMQLASDGNYYVGQVVKKTRDKNTENGDDQYKFSNGEKVASANGQLRYFKVEPILWRILDNNYADMDGNSTNTSLLWSVIAIDRVQFYDDGDDPFTTDNGGKKDRNIDAKTIKFNNYEYSTIRAFLRGEYVGDDTQNNASYYDKYVDLVGENKGGFIQRAFNSDNKLKAVTIEENVTDAAFLLSVNELSKPDDGYWFIKDIDNNSDIGGVAYKDQGKYRQAQCIKQLSDFTLARSAKRWSLNAMQPKDGELATGLENNPGAEWWTRTPTGTGIRIVGGTGRVYGSQEKKQKNGQSYNPKQYEQANISSGRGGYPDCSMVPAITLDNTKFTVLDPNNPTP